MHSWEQPVELDYVTNALVVAREDKLPGGTKARFLPVLMEGAREVVYGGPFCGGAALALAVVGQQLNIPVTLFYAERKHWHPRQLLAQSYGATLVPVKMGFQSHVSAQAERYAREHDARYFPLGYDVPDASIMLRQHLVTVRHRLGQPLNHIYCACSSGMLTDALATVWPEAVVSATCVGLKSKWSLRDFPPNVRLIEWPTALSTPAPGPKPPFPCCPYYEQKAWVTMQRDKPIGRVLFWNVLGDPVP